MEVGLILDIVSLVFLVITSALMALLAFLALGFAAKPKLKINLKDGRKNIELVKGKKRAIRFHIENVGHFYAKPAATNVKLYVNFEQPVEPVKIRYGSTLEKDDDKVLLGKHNSRYLKAKGIILFYDEPGEDIEIDVVAPPRSGRYCCWIAAHSRQGDCGVHRFRIDVLDKSGKMSANSLLVGKKRGRPLASLPLC